MDPDVVNLCSSETDHVRPVCELGMSRSQDAGPSESLICFPAIGSSETPSTSPGALNLAGRSCCCSCAGKGGGPGGDGSVCRNSSLESTFRIALSKALDRLS